MITVRHGSWVFWLLLALIYSWPLHAEAPRGASSPFFFGVALDGYPIGEERLKRLAAHIGMSPQIVVFFLQWPSAGDRDPEGFPLNTLNAIWDTGAIPCLTWEPMYYSGGREVMIPHQDILSGAYDPYVLGFAKQAAVWNRPFMIRFAHEMNLSRYHWGGGPLEYGPESPRIYREMYQHVATLFQKAGARNVVWAFCPNAESVPNTSYDPTAGWNRIENYYPGDAYVDVLGMDGYNWGTTQKKDIHGWESQWREFEAIFRPARETLCGLGPDKPLLVFETATVDQGGDKRVWIKNAFQTAMEWGLTGVAWFQAKKEYDWRITNWERSLCGKPPETAGCSPHGWIRTLKKGRNCLREENRPSRSAPPSTWLPGEGPGRRETRKDN